MKKPEFSLLIIASKGSPWAPNVLKNIALTGIKIHLVHVDSNKNEAYLNFHEKSVNALFAEVYKQMETVDFFDNPGRSKIRYLKLGKVIKRLTKTHSPSAVLTLYGGGFGLSAFLSGFRPYAIYGVGSDIVYCSKAAQLISKLTFSHACHVFTNGKSLLSAAAIISPKSSLTNLLIGIDLEKFSPSPVDLDKMQIICLRGFQEIYDNLTILKAIGQLKFREDVNFVFVAGGPLLNEAIKWADENLSPEQRTAVTFLGGVSPDEIVPIIQASHISISMSLSDGTSTCLLESMACGIFPIVSDIEANRSWIESTDGLGKLVPIQDFEALATAINQMVSQFSELFPKRLELRSVILNQADGVKNMAQLVKTMKQASGFSPDSKNI